MAQIDLRQATVRVADGGSNYIDVKVGEGSLDYTEKRQVDLVKSRGVLDTVRENEQQGMEVTLLFIWEHVVSYSGEATTVEEALKRTGPAASWTSASADTLSPYCVNLEIIYTPVCSGVKSEVFIFPMFHYTELAHNLKDGTISCKGTCNANVPYITRV